MKIILMIIISLLLAIGVIRFDFWLFKIITIISVIALILLLVYID